MDWNLVLQWSFLIALLSAGIRLAIPILITVLGEIITESAGILNLGLEGIMAMGAVSGFITAFYVENNIPQMAHLAPWIGLLAGILAGVVMGCIMGLLSITLQADQVISGITLVVFGLGLSNYLYRQAFTSLSERLELLPKVPIPLLSQIPVLGEVLFNHDLTVYMTVILVVLVWYFLFKTTWGLKIRSVGENPAAAETSGINVEGVRYSALLIGTALVGLAGAVLTVVQLNLFRENITAGKGWIAVALVIFARWRHPNRALVGALLFGLADSIQYRIQALSQTALGAATIPYEFLLMLPYALTIFVLLFRTKVIDEPAALGRPYVRSSR